MKFRIIMVTFIIATTGGFLQSQEGKQIGKVGSVTTGAKEVIVNIDSGKTININELNSIFVTTDNI